MKVNCWFDEYDINGNIIGGFSHYVELELVEHFIDKHSYINEEHPEDNIYLKLGEIL